MKSSCLTSPSSSYWTKEKQKNSNCNLRQSWILNSTPWTDPDFLSVELGLRTIVELYLKLYSRSCILDSKVQDSRIPGFHYKNLLDSWFHKQTIYLILGCGFPHMGTCGLLAKLSFLKRLNRRWLFQLVRRDQREKTITPLPFLKKFFGRLISNVVRYNSTLLAKIVAIEFAYLELEKFACLAT